MFLKLSFVFVSIPSIFAACPSGTYYDSGSNRCFKFVIERLTFFSAEQSCASEGGHLVSINNAFENALISETARSIFGDTTNFWIGANLLMSSQWSYTDNTTFSFSNWAPSQPSTLCAYQFAYVETSNGLWSTADRRLKPYVCSVSQIPIQTTPAACTTQKPTTCPAPKPLPGHCESGWTYFDQTDACYKVLLDENFDHAEATCMAAEAHLASVHSQAEDNFLTDLSSSGLNVTWTQLTWSGLRKANYVWTWTDNSPVDYINWLPNLPHNDQPQNCMQLITDHILGGNPAGVLRKWNEIDCFETMRAFICKKAALH